MAVQADNAALVPLASSHLISVRFLEGVASAVWAEERAWPTRLRGGSHSWSSGRTAAVGLPGALR